MELWEYERAAWREGAETVCGVDEAGAGPLMGPVYAAAVILPRELDIPGLNDSKKLTEKKREALYEIITAQAAAWSVARVEAAEIDEMDILNARMLVMQRAIDGLSLRPELALIDGNRDHGSRYAIETPHCLIVGGDGKSASIAAASILAKVSRDRYVAEVLDKQYPQYQFAKHKGYGTKLHYQMLDRYGPCPEHRETFLKKWEARRRGCDPPGRKPGRGRSGPLSAAKRLYAAGKPVALQIRGVGSGGQGPAGNAVLCGSKAPGKRCYRAAPGICGQPQAAAPPQRCGDVSFPAGVGRTCPL